jgi:hypothetical protein
MGLFAIGSSALGISLGVDVKVLKEAPGPHSIMAWKPGAGSTACGIVVTGVCAQWDVDGRGLRWWVGGVAAAWDLGGNERQSEAACKQCHAGTSGGMPEESPR